MIYSGTDLCSIPRIEKSMKNPRFLARVFSREEIALFEKRGMSPQTVAANWAAKEAFSKALGTGIRGFSLREVAVLRDSLGAPFLQLSGMALAVARQRNLHFSVSLSHTAELALAFVIAYDAAPCHNHALPILHPPQPNAGEKGTLN